MHYIYIEAPVGFGKTLAFSVFASKKARRDSILYLSPYHSALADCAANLFLMDRPFVYFVGVVVPGETSGCLYIRTTKEMEKAPFFDTFAVGLPVHYGCLSCKYAGEALCDALTCYYRLRGMSWLADELGGDEVRGRQILEKLVSISCIIPAVRLPEIMKKVEEKEESAGAVAKTRAMGESLISAEEWLGVKCAMPLISAFPSLFKERVVLATHAYSSSASRLVSLLANIKKGRQPPWLILDEFDNYLLEPDYLPLVTSKTWDSIEAETAFLEELLAKKPSVLSDPKKPSYSKAVEELLQYLRSAKSYPILEKLADVEGIMNDFFSKNKVVVYLPRSKILVLESKYLKKYRLLLLVPEILDMYKEHMSGAKSALSFLYSLFGDILWPEPKFYGEDVKDYVRTYFFALDDKKRVRLASYESKLSLLLLDRPFPKKLVFLCATALRHIVSPSGSVTLPFLLVRGYKDYVELYRKETADLWKKLSVHSVEWSFPEDKVAVLFVRKLEPFVYSSEAGALEALRKYQTMAEKLVLRRPYDKLIICQNKAVAAVLFLALYRNKNMFYIPENEELVHLPPVLAEMYGLRSGADYYYCLARDPKNPSGYKQIFITWLRSRLTRGVRINAVIDTVLVCGSPYPPPQTLSCYRPDMSGVSDNYGTALYLSYGETGYLVHSVPEVHRAINDLIQALARPLRVAEAIFASERLSEIYSDFNLLIVLPEFLRKKLMVFAPAWFKRLMTPKRNILKLAEKFKI